MTARSSEGAAALSPGRRVGRYRLVRLLGSGGMGSVYEAEQDEPRRTVAVKLLARAEDPDALARFRYEAEILAQLSHPGIAQVYEFGTERETDEQAIRELPWFAMEHVPMARTLVEYAEADRLDLRARLRLFLRVGDAVHYGHQKGVIHRDLKPANLLVDGAGHPKVIDFGIARLTTPEGPQRSLRTSTGQVLGTLRYMSPEQVSGERGAVDVQSDLFALGLVLFELAARRPAYDLEGLSLTEAVRAVAEARVPLLRDADAGIPAELEWIVQRACAPERERRYPSVSELSADLERFLRGEAVSAAPPDSLYRLRVFMRRHRWAVGAAAVVVASIALSLAVLSRSLSIERESLAAEREQRVRAQGNAEFLAAMLSSVSPSKQGYDVPLRDVLDEAAPRVAERFADQPLLRADLHHAIGDAYRSISRHAEAIEHARAALAIRAQRLPPDDPSRLATQALLGFALRGVGRPAEAEPVLRDALAGLDGALGPHDARSALARRGLADVLIDLDRLEEARSLLAPTFDGRAPETIDLDESSIALVSPWLRIAFEKGRFDELDHWLERLEGERLNLSPELAAKLADMQQNRGIQLVEEGRIDEAEEVFLGALKRTDSLFGPTSKEAITLRNNLANVALLRDDGEAALGWLDDAADAAQDAFGAAHPDTLTVRYTRAGALWVLGEKERAMEEFGRVLEASRTALPAGHVDTGERAGTLGRAYVATGRSEEALTLLQEATEILSRARGDEYPTTQLALTWLVRALDETGRGAEADALRPRLQSRTQ